MKKFYNVHDVDQLNDLLNEALELKKNPLKYAYLGKNKSICLLFFNPSLRTRLSTQKAAFNLGMNISVMNIGKEGWKLEFEDGTVMDGDKAEHIKEAAAVVGAYFDIVAIRAFPNLLNKDEDYEDRIIRNFMTYAKVPVINLESAVLHPLQSFADLITIEEYKNKTRPKVVLTWAPHPKALPQSVPNSFIEWMKIADVDLIVTHPQGYELAPDYTKEVEVEYDQEKAFENADFIYAKNWSSYHHYGQVLNTDKSWMITMDKLKKTDNARFMHCLPVRRNVVVEDKVLDSEQSIVIPQSVNRIVSAQTVIKKILESN